MRERLADQVFDKAARVRMGSNPARKRDMLHVLRGSLLSNLELTELSARELTTIWHSNFWNEGGPP